MMNDNTPVSRTTSRMGYSRRFDTFSMSPVGPVKSHDDFGSMAKQYKDEPKKPSILEIPAITEESLLVSPKAADITCTTSPKNFEGPNGEARRPYRGRRDSQDHTRDFSQDIL